MRCCSDPPKRTSTAPNTHGGRKPEQPSSSRENRPAPPMPEQRGRWWAIEPPPRAGSLPEVAPRAPPRGFPKEGTRWFRDRGRGAGCAAPTPPERGRRGARRNLAERPTSRLCSADESVASLSPLPATRRSFLPWASWSPSRSPALRTIPAMPVPVSPSGKSRSSSLGDPDPGRRGEPRRWRSMESLRWFTRRPMPKQGERRRRGGPKPNPDATPFQRGGGTRCRAGFAHAAEAVAESPSSATGVYPEHRVGKSGSAMPPRTSTTRRWRRFEGSPAGLHIDT